MSGKVCHPVIVEEWQLEESKRDLGLSLVWLTGTPKGISHQGHKVVMMGPSAFSKERTVVTNYEAHTHTLQKKQTY